jgi:chemotaxis protein CheZ
MSSVQKRFRIEQTLRAGAIPEPGATAVADASPQMEARLSEILTTVQDLKRFLDPAQKVATDVIDAYRTEIAQVYQLRAELDTMKEAISSTKREIASLYRSDNEGKGMRRVAGELDAVVGATELATTTILGGLEDIENHAQVLRAMGVDVSGNDHVGQILERIVSMYEACNFQDLTGQRIGKIVNVLKFVEERLDKMIGVWGGLDAFKELIQADGAPADEEASLLNGPKLEEDVGHVDQNDIDALFD